MTRLLPLLLCTPALFAEAGAGPVTVGSPAPAFKVARWVKGEPLPSLEQGRVYVVEFWATWCGPCRQTIPHLTELAKRFQGKATFIGVDVWERGEAAAVDKTVDDYVKEMGGRMAYNVARDTADNHMAQAWMQAARQDGIPTAFIVNEKGQIAWIGHPMEGLDTTLAAVIEGRHDMAAAKADADRKAERAAKRRDLIAEFMKPLSEAQKAKDYAKLQDLSRKAEAKYPELADMVFGFKFLALLRTAPEDAKALLAAEQKKAEPERIAPARVILGEAGLDRSWYETAASLIEAELKEPEASPALHGLRAKALHLAGRNQEAVAAQEQLLSLARGKAAPEARIKQYEEDLRTYQAAAKGKG